MNRCTLRLSKWFLLTSVPLLCTMPAFSQPIDIAPTILSPAEIAKTSSDVASDSANVTQMRASIIQASGKKVLRQAEITDALVDGDPRYRDNFVEGLRSGIVQGTLSGAYRPYVWGGASTANYPYVVAVVGTREICSGIVLNGNVVMTAAHCFCNTIIRAIHTGAAVFQGSPISVVGEPKTMEPSYCESARTGVDVGLLYLPLTTNLPSARLPTQADLATVLTRRPNILRLVGYGLTKDGGIGAKNYVDLPVASPNCGGSVPLPVGSASDADYYGCLANRELVAGAVGLDVDACGGDSGAPLLLDQGTSMTVVAISSRSVNRRRACGDGAVYGLLDASVLSFLKTAIAER